MSEMYPWPGKFYIGSPDSPVAIVTLDDKIQFKEDKVAIWGPMKTENLGIEKVIANVLSNPNIRFLIVCGNEIRGHKSGKTLVKLVQNGTEENGRIKDAPGAVPYIENLDSEAVERFREQITVIDMVGVTDMEKIQEKIDHSQKNDPGSYGEPYTAVKIKEKEETTFSADIALHASIKVDPWGEVSEMEEL